MNRRKRKLRFENSRDIGSYVDIQFEVSGETELGQESIRFETKVHYFEEGEGQPLLLIHGIGQSLYTWHNSIDFFAENGFRVIAIDLPGFGYSAHPAIYYTIDEYAMIIEAFLNALRIKKTDIAAFSTGCLSAAYLAVQHPQRVGRLVFVSPGGPNENYPFMMRSMTTWIGHTLARAFMNEASIQRILRGLYFDATLVTDEKVDEYFAPYKDKDVRDTLAIAMTHFDDRDVRAMLKSLRHKVLVFSGLDDSIHTAELTRIYYTMPQGAKHICMRNCGHFAHEEKPQRFNSAALEFLQTKNADER